MSEPLKLNQVVELEIKEIVQGGEGLAKYENFAVFVPQSVPGDIIQAKIISVKPNYARALINEILYPSELRVKPQCSVVRECGGCQSQEMAYKDQLKTKEKILFDNLHRIGDIPEDILEKAKNPIIGMENPYFYRNKGQFPFEKEKGKIRGGFYYPKSHNIVEFDRCYIQNDKINFVFRKVKSLLKKYDISIYDEKTHKGFFRHLIVKHAFTTNQTLIGFVTSPGKFPEIDKIIEFLTEEIPELVGIVQNINDKQSNSILGEKNKIIYGNDYITEQLEDLKFRISIDTFFQVNPVQAVCIFNTVLDFAGLTGKETVLDAYAGAGAIAIWTARFAKQVIGVEMVKSAVDNGILNSKLNNVENVTLINAKVEEILPKILYQNPCDIVILDPPRKGCEDFILNTLEENRVKKIIYVSCNPATLARDAKILCSSNYRLKTFLPVDMFPQTYHLETVALFEYEKSDG